VRSPAQKGLIGLDQRYREGTCGWKVMATRYVLRTGEVIHSNRNPEELDVYCYRTGANDHTCLLLSDQSEADFLLRYGSDELNVAY